MADITDKASKGNYIGGDKDSKHKRINKSNNVSLRRGRSSQDIKYDSVEWINDIQINFWVVEINGDGLVLNFQIKLTLHIIVYQNAIDLGVYEFLNPIDGIGHEKRVVHRSRQRNYLNGTESVIEASWTQRTLHGVDLQITCKYDGSG